MSFKQLNNNQHFSSTALLMETSFPTNIGLLKHCYPLGDVKSVVLSTTFRTTLSTIQPQCQQVADIFEYIYFSLYGVRCHGVKCHYINTSSVRLNAV